MFGLTLDSHSWNAREGKSAPYSIHNLEKGPNHSIFFDKVETLPLYDDPLVIIVQVMRCEIRKVMIDKGSTSDIMYLDTLKKIGVWLKEIIRKELPLVNFKRSMSISVRKIRLPVSLEGAIMWINFEVLDIH